MKFFLLKTIAIAALVFVTHHTTNAQVNGFGGFADWTYRQGDTGVAASVEDNAITITTGTRQFRNVWLNDRQNIESFTASFRYQSEGSNTGMGASFIVHNDPDGANALSDGVGNGFGPPNLGFGGIDSSLGVLFALGNNRSASTGVLRDGRFGSGLTAIAPSASGDGFDVTVSYENARLSLLVDDGANTPFSQTLIVPDLAIALGSNEAYIGFGASAGNFAGTQPQRISNFRFQSGTVAIPEPSAGVAMLVLGSFVGCWRKRA